MNDYDPKPGTSARLAASRLSDGTSVQRHARRAASQVSEAAPERTAPRRVARHSEATAYLARSPLVMLALVVASGLIVAALIAVGMKASGVAPLAPAGADPGAPVVPAPTLVMTPTATLGPAQVRIVGVTDATRNPNVLGDLLALPDQVVTLAAGRTGPTGAHCLIALSLVPEQVWVPCWRIGQVNATPTPQPTAVPVPPTPVPPTPVPTVCSTSSIGEIVVTACGYDLAALDRETRAAVMATSAAGLVAPRKN